jgi:prevent-host-death family protein
MKHVDISEVTRSFAQFVDEAGQGQEIVITRDGLPLAKLVSAEPRRQPESDPPYTAEEVAKRRQALMELRDIGKRLNIKATHEQIKAWIEEGRH